MMLPITVSSRGCTRPSSCAELATKLLPTTVAVASLKRPPPSLAELLVKLLAITVATLSLSRARRSYSTAIPRWWTTGGR